jgi:transcriptional regulator with XRE-family HTH domain
MLKPLAACGEASRRAPWQSGLPATPGTWRSATFRLGDQDAHGDVQTARSVVRLRPAQKGSASNMPSTSATVAQRRLARALRKLRAEADLTIEQVAENVDLSASTLSRLETAQAVVRRGDIRELLDIYQVTGAQREELLQLAGQSRQQPWWQEFKDLPEAAGADLEAQAAVIRQYSALLVPGLLQTEAYAREILRAVRGDDAFDNPERHLKLRMNRQALLSEQESPAYVVVLDEPVVRRVVGGRQIMHAQLQRLVEASALPSVTLHLLPFSVGAHAGMDGEFTIFSYSKDPDVVYEDPDVVYVDNIVGGEYIEDPMVTKRYNQAFHRLLDMALDPVKSAQALADIAEQLAITERG